MPIVKNWLRGFSVARKKRNLRNSDFTIISRDCTGAMLLHDLGLRFDTPTVNLFMRDYDFIKFCTDPHHYLALNEEMAEDPNGGMDYPVGILGDIRLYFVHYKTFVEAKSKWIERSKRIHWDNIYFIMTDGKWCTDELAAAFDALPWKHKAFLTNVDCPNIKSAVKLDAKTAGLHMMGAPEVFRFKKFFSLRKAIDDWDFISFLNNKN